MTTLRAVIAGVMVAVIAILAVKQPWLTFLPAVVLYLAIVDPKSVRARFRRGS